MIPGHRSDDGPVAREKDKTDDRQHREATATHSSNGRFDHRTSEGPATR